jgi:hypothetical protein
MATVTKKPGAHRQLLNLPFDQYSRQYLVRELIDKAIRPKPKQQLSIIDLGGHKGKTQEFLPSDKVTILDVFDEEYEGYVKGDATRMTFADKSFDIACSFDVFEHIPRQKRQDFLSEALRVSRLGVFVAMPVDGAQEAVSKAEKTLNSVHRVLYGTDHQWLKEHIDYRIPNKKEVESLLDQIGTHYVSLGSNQITDWQLLQTVIFVAAGNPHVTETAQDLNTWYNLHLSEIEKGVDTGYRRIYFLTRDKNLRDRVNGVLNNLFTVSASEDARYIPVHQAVLDKTVRAVAAVGSSFLTVLEQKETAERIAAQELSGFRKHLQNLEQDNAVLRGQLQGVYQSVSWRFTKPLRLLMRLLRKIG